MTIEIETDNPFHAGWLAHYAGLPRDSDSDKIFQDGWDMGHETLDLKRAREYYRNVINQAEMGQMYLTFLAEAECGHHTVSIKRRTRRAVET
jgi:hypothetical protein